jgi:hypothetical protein
MIPGNRTRPRLAALSPAWETFGCTWGMTLQKVLPLAEGTSCRMRFELPQSCWWLQCPWPWSLAAPARLWSFAMAQAAATAPAPAAGEPRPARSAPVPNSSMRPEAFQIQVFGLDHTSGALSSVGTVPGPTINLGLAAVDHQFLQVSDPLNGQLDGFAINQTAGGLTPLLGSPCSTGTVSAPEGLASPAGSNLLYAADTARVDGLTVNSAGTPSAISGSPFPSGTNLFLATDPSGELP